MLLLVQKAVLQLHLDLVELHYSALGLGIELNDDIIKIAIYCQNKNGLPNGFDEKNTQNLPTLGPHGMGNVDIGNILDRSFDEFYDSEVFEIPENSGISKVNVDAIIPLKCDVQVMFKCADTKDELKNKPWSGPIGENSRFSIDSSVDKYIYQGKYMQFRLSLYAYNALNTPRVKSVSISFEQL